VARLRNEIGDPIRVQYKHLARSRLVSTGAEEGWALELRHAEGWKRGSSKKAQTLLLTGEEAVQAAGQLMSRVNRAGGRRSTIQTAVERIEEAGNPAVYMRVAAREAERLHRAKVETVSPSKRRKVTAGSLKGLPVDA